MSRLALIILTIGLLSASGAPKAYADAIADCNQSSDVERRIRGCSTLIQRGNLSREELAKAHNNRGNAHQNKREYDRAIADYNEAIRLVPTHSRLHNRGTAYLRKGDNDRAIADYSEAIRLNPKEASPYTGRGDAYRAKGDYDRAIADYNVTIRLDAKNFHPYNGRGLAYHAKGDDDRAIAEYNMALRLDPKQAMLHNNRGNSYQRKGDTDRAIADYNEAIRLDPKFAIPYYNRGIAFRAKGDDDRAIADYNEAIRLNPKYASAYGNRAFAYHGKGEDGRAIADFNEAIRLEPQNAARYANRSLFYLSKGEIDAALVDSGEAIRRNPNDAVGHWARGFLEFRQAEFHRASADFQRALELKPVQKDEPYVVLLRFLALSRAGQAASVELEAHAQRLENKQLHNKRWPYPLIELYLGRRSPDTIFSAARTPGERCEAQFYLGEWHLLRGDRALAADMLKIAAETCPKSIQEHLLVAAELTRLGVSPDVQPAVAPPAPAPAGRLPAAVPPAVQPSITAPMAKATSAAAPLTAPPSTLPIPSARPKPRQVASAFIGCFRDQGNPWGKEGRDLDGARWDDTAMTTARCISFCRSQNYTYAATQYSVACFCGNNYGRSSRADNCNMPCAGNAKEMCGGFWANSVWRVEAGSAEAPGVAPPLPDDGNFTSASDASLKPHNGVWATSRALCSRYARHISNAKYLGDVTNFVSPQDEGAYLISSRSIRFFDEASNECRLVKIDGLPKATSATMTCSNAVNPDISTVVLNIVKSNQNYIFKWKQQYGGVRDEKVYQCISMRELSETMARLWTFDSKKCAATTAHPEADIIFSKDLEENLIITVSGKIGSAFTNDFAARIFIDQLPPIELSATAISAGFSLPLGPLASRSSMFSDGFLMSVWTEEMASRGSGVYKVPVLELPLLGSGRAMTFLRQCQHKSALAPAPSDQQRAQQFIRDFIARLDRELPDFKHKEPRHKVVDLNDDGRSDIILVADSPGYCGSAGCDMFVYVAGANGQFHPVYEKKSGDESLPAVGPERKDGYLTLAFPYAAIGDRVVHEVAVWEKAQYRRSHYRDGDIRIDPIPAEQKDGFKTDGVLRDRPSLSAAPVESSVGFGFDMELGTVVTGQGSWIVARHCKGCRFGYARIQE